jgi:dihydroorotate dehydrogenase
MSIYENWLRPLLFLMDPETAHQFTIRLLEWSSHGSAFWNLVSRPTGPGKNVFGVHFPNPIGLAAGLDKNAVALPAWARMGFGFVEVGTITTVAQPGNPKPRIFRIPEQEALINRLGFNNEGAERVAIRLEALKQSGHWPSIPIGINLGKSKITPLDKAAEDYRRSYRVLSHLGDYFVLNVSSPNTPGLRLLQQGDAIKELFSVFRSEPDHKPLLVKIAPDLDWPDVELILEVVDEFGLAGVIATNTTIDQAGVPERVRTEGGLSGFPLQRRAMEILKFIKKQSHLPVISVGGIMHADEALRRLDAGADLIQVYTGLIYRGPKLIADILGLIEPAKGRNGQRAENG